MHLEKVQVLLLSINQLFWLNFVQLMMLIAWLADNLEFETVSELIYKDFAVGSDLTVLLIIDPIHIPLPLFC